MKRNSLIGVFLMVTALLLIACAALKPVEQPEKEPPVRMFIVQDLNPQLKAGRAKKKVDNFMVILDRSGSMAELYKGQSKLAQAEELISRMNQTIPDITLTGALRIFGRIATFSTKETELLYGPATYTKEGLKEGLGKVERARGMSPLELAIGAAGEDLKATQGPIALIIISDGEEMNNSGVVNAAKNIKGQFGDRLCIYTVLMGNDPDGKKMMKKVAATGQCGFFAAADQIISSKNMADFVEKAFLTRIKVVKPVRKAPIVRKKIVRRKPAPPSDRDGDGVYDKKDRCPKTPKGAKVDSRGCWELESVHFGFNKWNIKPQDYLFLDKVAKIMKRNPSLRMKFEGNTDNIGSAKYNIGLSEKRAISVKGYFVKKGINPKRITTVGYGFTRPIATNSIPKGRALNRRTNLKPMP